jgi:hypothetical protein
MVEAARRVPAWAVLVLGFVLAWVPLLWNAWPSCFGLWLAQPLLIIGWGRLRGERALPWREDALSLLLLLRWWWPCRWSPCARAAHCCRPWD